MTGPAPLRALALLLLSLAAPAAAASTLGDGEAIEHALLPAVTGKVGLRVESLGATVVIEVPGRGAATVARALRRAPLAICPTVAEGAGEVRLGCRSRRIVARLLHPSDGTLLQLREVKGLPWAGEDAPPLVEHSPVAGAEASLDALVRGDFAAAEGDLRAAGAAWAQVRGGPYGRLASARLCELSWECLETSGLDTVYEPGDANPDAARELTLRRARALAFMDRPLEGARELLAGPAGRRACSGAPATCRRVLLAALRSPRAEERTEALAYWMALPDRGGGSRAYELDVAAADAAQAAGAPAFAANVLAAAAGRVPHAALPEHLLRTAELYLEADDRVRAGVVLEFARARSSRTALASPRWVKVTRAVGRRPAQGGGSIGAPPAALDTREAEALLADARRALSAPKDPTSGGRP